MEVTLAELMKKVLADSFIFYLKAHSYHWNVEGPNFMQYHLFLGGLYTEVWGAIDLIAENIRVLNKYSPGTTSKFKEISTIEEDDSIPDALTMLRNLEADNKIVLATLKLALKFAEREDNQGILNFIAGRIEIHEKHGWMLRSYIK